MRHLLDNRPMHIENEHNIFSVKVYAKIILSFVFKELHRLTRSLADTAWPSGRHPGLTPAGCRHC